MILLNRRFTPRLRTGSTPVKLIPNKQAGSSERTVILEWTIEAHKTTESEKRELFLP